MSDSFVAYTPEGVGVRDTEGFSLYEMQRTNKTLLIVAQMLFFSQIQYVYAHVIVSTKREYT